MPVLQKGCCCAELETCAAIIGWLGIVFSIFNIIGYFVMGYHWLDIIVYVIVGIAHLIVSGLLIKSTKNRKPTFVTPWLIVAVLETVVMVILNIVVLVAVEQPSEHIAGAVIGMLIGVGLAIYFWLCIYSYYQQLSNQ